MAVLSNCYLTKNLLNLTLPDSFSIPYPKPAGGSPIPALHPGGQLINFLKNAVYLLPDCGFFYIFFCISLMGQFSLLSLVKIVFLVHEMELIINNNE